GVQPFNDTRGQPSGCFADVQTGAKARRVRARVIFSLLVFMKRKRYSPSRWIILQGLRLFKIRGQSEKIARGFAIGLALNFVPTFGFGALIAGFVARLCGGNGIAGLAGGASLSLVWPLLFYLNIRV